CSKRRLDAIAKTVNQIAKTQKLPAKHINQGFFDPSILLNTGRMRLPIRTSRDLFLPITIQLRNRCLFVVLLNTSLQYVLCLALSR
ncbi:hypothetical protein, partial [Acetobacter estunensis]|uniref:hypothetical protein n=1 Tax=Acetobacter estunensis TaxID=104097 RepID=UPI001A7E1E22